MDRTRVSLDNPAFAGRLRQPSRSPAYVHRPTPRPVRVIQDISLKPVTAKVRADAPGFAPVKNFHRADAPKPSPVSARVPATQKPTRSVLPAAQIVRHQPQKSGVLMRQTSGSSRRSQAKSKRLPVKKQTVVLYAMALVLFVVGIVVSLNGLRANRQVAAQVRQLTSKHTDSSNGDSSAPSTVKPSAASIAGYVVAPNLPRYIDIPKLGVHARVLSLGILASGALATPGNVYDTGWYNASAQPGQNGAMLVDGHISSWTTHGVFYGLNKLVAGDAITITRGDGKTFTYKVVKSAIVDAKKVDMASMLVSANTAKPGLNLISCSGDVIPGTNEFDKRITVYAVM